MIETARDYWFFIAVFIVIGLAYMKAAREIIKRIIGRKDK